VMSVPLLFPREVCIFARNRSNVPPD